MKRLVSVLFALLAFSAVQPAAAQSLDALLAAEAGVDAAWEASPLAFRKVLFASEIQAYGIYTERPETTFKVGEEIMLYAEPVGYGYKVNDDGTYNFGLNFDLTLKSRDGEILGGQENFAKVDLASHTKNREFLVTLTLNLNDAPAGEYVVEYLAHDLNSAKTATISLPITIVE